MTDAVEKEELGDYKSLDQHDSAGNDDSYEADNVHDTDKVEYDVAWSSQGFFKEWHFLAYVGGRRSRERVKEDMGLCQIDGLFGVYCFALIMRGGGVKRETDTDQQLVEN